MNPQDIGSAYDQITCLWESDDFDISNGVAQHERAIAFAKNRGKALDVGCGCTGRFIDLLRDNGFSPEGVDVSQQMIKLARKKHPEILFHHQDICEWSVPGKYDFITAWDSIWHVPLDKQASVLAKLIARLNVGGVLIFSCGGTNGPNEYMDDAMGVDMCYSSPGVGEILKLCLRSDSVCRHVEYDQYPELHTWFIVEKVA